MVKYRLSAPGTSRSCSRVMSPEPGFSTLITSAPNQASSCVQVGPDCTCVKSRMRMPSNALAMRFLGSWVLPLCEMRCPHGLERGERENPCDYIERHRNGKHRAPAVCPGNGGRRGCQQRACALRGIQHAGVGGRELRAEGVALGRGKKAEDLAVNPEI